MRIDQEYIWGEAQEHDFKELKGYIHINSHFEVTSPRMIIPIMH
jgi:hypothetical protein